MSSVRTLLCTTVMALGIAAPASALTFSVTSTPYTAGAPGGYSAMCGPTDPACRDRWTGSYAITTVDVVNRHLSPAGWSGEYASVPSPLNGPGGTATLSFAGVGPITSWSLLWGSAGPNNLLELFHTGSATPFVVNMNNVISNNLLETPTERINRWVTITGDMPFTATMARFTHPNYAFETTAFGVRPYTTPLTGGVPEPAIWAMLLIGFGLTGIGMRRRGLRQVAS